MSWGDALRNFFWYLLLSVCVGCQQERLEIGEMAPALAVHDLQNQPVALESWAGRKIYLTFWSARCGSCIAEMGVLETLSKIYADKVTVVAVNTDPPQVNVHPLLLDKQIDYPVLRDQLGITQERYEVTGTPVAFYIDADGRVTEKHQGARNEQALRASFQRWLTQ